MADAASPIPDNTPLVMNQAIPGDMTKSTPVTVLKYGVSKNQEPLAPEASFDCKVAIKIDSEMNKCPDNYPGLNPE